MIQKNVIYLWLNKIITFLKRIAYISVISVTSILMLLLSAIPHHHHQEGLHCFKTEQVEHNCDEQHAHHHNPTKNNNSESSNCILHANFVLEQLDTNVRIKSFSINYYNDNEFNACYAISVLKHINILLPVKRIDICEYVYYLISAYKTSPFGLRAPPITLA